MISRLFLIGVVGALGLSFPDGPEWGSGSARAQAEATARFGCRHAVAFEPIAVDADSRDSLADELNRRNDGLDAPAPPIVSVVSSPRAAFAPTPSGDTVDLKLMAELCGLIEEAESRGPAGDPEVDALFAENRVWAEPAVHQDPASPSPAHEPCPSFEPIDVASDTSSLADDLNRASDGQSLATDTDRGIGNAIRLTRNAALAWINVLTNTTTDSAPSR